MKISDMFYEIKAIISAEGGAKIIDSFKPPATNHDIFLRLNSHAGVSIPTDFVDFLSIHNGQSGKNRFCEDGRLLSVDEMLIESKAINNFQQEYETAGWKKTFIPFTDGNGGDYLLLDCETGAVYKFWNDDDVVEFAYESFSEWLSSVLTTYRKKEFALCEGNLDFWQYE